MTEKFELKVSNSQYAAVENIRGLEAAAHSMVMCASFKHDGWILNGTTNDFEKLMGDLHMEVDERLCPKKNLHLLVQVINKIEEEIPFEEIF